MRKLLSISYPIIITFALIIVFCVTNTETKQVLFSSATGYSGVYTMNFTSTKNNPLTYSSESSGSYIAKTNLGNNVEINYSGVSIESSNNFAIFSDGGSMEFHLAGISAIRIDFDGPNERSLDVWCGYEGEDYIGYPFGYCFFESEDDGVKYYFDDPFNYIYIYSDGINRIKSLLIEYSCNEAPIPEEHRTKKISFYDNSTLLRTNTFNFGEKVELRGQYYSFITGRAGNFFYGWTDSEKRYLYNSVVMDNDYALYAYVINPVQALSLYYYYDGEKRASDSNGNIVDASFYSMGSITLTGVYTNYYFEINGTTGRWVQMTDQPLFDTATGTTIPAGSVLQQGTATISLSYTANSNKISATINSYSTTRTYTYSRNMSDNSRSALYGFLMTYISNYNTLPLTRTLKKCNIYYLS